MLSSHAHPHHVLLTLNQAQQPVLHAHLSSLPQLCLLGDPHPKPWAGSQT